MISTLKNRYTTAKNTFMTRTQPARNRASRFFHDHPFKALFSLLGLLVLLIIISNLLNRPTEDTTTAETKPKKVEIYQIGSAPRITVQAQTEKSGVVTITALSGGVVQQIFVEPGSDVSAGQSLLSLSSTYQGGNLPYLQLSVVAAQLKNTEETFQTQKDIIAKQREAANKNEENSEELRNVSRESQAATKEIIDLNDQILRGVNATIDSPVASAEAKGEAFGLKTQLLSANAQLRSQLRANEYDTHIYNPPTALAEINRDIALKQLDIQEKAITLGLEVSRLQYQIAAVGAQAMQPSSPFRGTVQRVFVKYGQAVSPGTPLMVLSQAVEDDPIVAIAYVSADIAKSISYAEPSILTIGKTTYETYPSYITRDAIEGSLYGVYYPIPDSYNISVTDSGYINVQIPIGSANTSAAIPFIPIDSVYQTEDESFVFVAKDGVASSKKVALGPVVGRYVIVEEGIKSGDRIILNRDIVSGDSVSTK